MSTDQKRKLYFIAMDIIKNFGENSREFKAQEFLKRGLSLEQTAVNIALTYPLSNEAEKKFAIKRGKKYASQEAHRLSELHILEIPERVKFNDIEINRLIEPQQFQPIESEIYFEANGKKSVIIDNLEIAIKATVKEPVTKWPEYLKNDLKAAISLSQIGGEQNAFTEWMINNIEKYGKEAWRNPMCLFRSYNLRGSDPGKEQSNQIRAEIRAATDAPCPFKSGDWNKFYNKRIFDDWKNNNKGLIEEAFKKNTEILQPQNITKINIYEKRTICEALISGKWYRIPVEVLRGYNEHERVLRRCPECKIKIKLMKESHDGKKAHFEHYRRNSSCPESIAFGKKQFNDNVHTYVKATREDIVDSHRHEALLDRVLLPSEENVQSVEKDIDEIVNIFKPKGNIGTEVKKRIKAGSNDEGILNPSDIIPTSDESELNEKVSNLLKRGFSGKPKGQINPQAIQSTRTIYIRDPQVKAWVLDNAKGICERCAKPGPFIDKKMGLPFLEVHHIIPLAESGPDTIDNSVGLCPNCHRECHLGEDMISLRKELQKKIIR